MMKIIEKIKKSQPIQRWRRLEAILKDFAFKPTVFIAPAGLGFVASMLDVASISLLIPTVKGVIERNFLFCRDIFFLGQVIEIFSDALSPFFENRNSGIFVILIVLIFLTVLIKNITLYFSRIMTLYQVRKFSNDLRQRIYERYLAFGKVFFDQNNSGHLHQILVAYTNQLSSEIQVVSMGFLYVFSILGYLVAMFYVSWQLSLFALPVFPLAIWFTQWIVRKIQKTSTEFATAFSLMGKKIANALGCIALIKANSTEEREKKWFQFVSDRIMRLQWSIDRKQVFVQPAQETIMMSMILLMVAFMAFLVVKEQAGHVAGFLVYFIMLRRVMSFFTQLSHIYSSLATVYGPAREISKVFNPRGKPFIQNGDVIFTGLKEKIEFKNVSFAYPSGQIVLQELYCTFEKKRMTAIVGPSGSGKTTLAHLMVRFYDAVSGEILFDGLDIRAYQLDTLHAQIGFVSQEANIFNASIRINLGYGLLNEPTEFMILEALKKAKLYEFVMNLPHKLDEEVGDRGVKLSGGEKQRLSLARVILKNPEIVILDEATSSLDSVTERLVQDAIEETIKDKTAIVIAHRLSTIQHADKIMVLKGGRIAETGDLKELLELQGEFYKYWSAQKFD